jgi:hypothetical protein
MIHSALEDLENSLEQKLTRWNKYESLVSSFPEASDSNIRETYSYLIQAALFSEKGISTKELETASQESYYTVKKFLSKIKPELLISDMKGKTKYYQLNLSALDNILLENELHSLPAQ